MCIYTEKEIEFIKELFQSFLKSEENKDIHKESVLEVEVILENINDINEVEHINLITKDVLENILFCPAFFKNYEISDLDDLPYLNEISKGIYKKFYADELGIIVLSKEQQNSLKTILDEYNGYNYFQKKTKENLKEILEKNISFLNLIQKNIILYAN